MNKLLGVALILSLLGGINSAHARKLSYDEEACHIQDAEYDASVFCEYICDPYEAIFELDPNACTIVRMADCDFGRGVSCPVTCICLPPIGPPAPTNNPGTKNN